MNSLNFVFGICIGIVIIHKSSAMFEVLMSEFNPLIKSGELMNMDDLKVTRFNRTTFVLNGSFILSNIDSVVNVMATCNLYRKGGNEYRLLPFKMGPGDLCNMIKEDEFFYAAFYAATLNFPPFRSCDFHSGTYYIKNFLPDLSSVPPVFQSGDYMIECRLSRNGHLINGYKFYGTLFNIADAKSNDHKAEKEETSILGK